MATTGDDCYFFYYSSCSKGPACPYRHSEAALGNEVTCVNWKQGFCYRPNCAFRHMEITKNRSEIACYWESQPVGCQKAHCPFKHSKRPSADGTSALPALPTASLINRLPTITGPVTKPPPPVTSKPHPTTQMTSVNLQPSGQPDSHSLLDDGSHMITPMVRPIVVQPGDSEDDESLGTLSTDGSPGKRVSMSPLRPTNKPPMNTTLGDRLSPRRQPIIRPTSKIRPDTTNEKPFSLGIKTLAEIQRKKEAERGHFHLEEEREGGGSAGDRENEAMEEGDDIPSFSSLSRRVISVSDSNNRKMNLDKRTTAVKTFGKESGQAPRTVSGEKPGVKSLAQLREERFKRLAGSLDLEEGATGNIPKRLKIQKREPRAEDSAEGEGEEGAVKKMIVRRVMVGGRGGDGRDGLKAQADSSGLESIKIKTVAEIRKEKLKQRLGENAADSDTLRRIDSSSAVQRKRLVARLGGIITESEDSEGGKKDISTQDSSIERRGRIEARLGRVLRATDAGGDGFKGDRSSGGDSTTNQKSRLAGRLGKVVRGDGDGEKGDLNSGGGIMIKSLAEIKREKLLQRLGKHGSYSDGEGAAEGSERVSSSRVEDDGDKEESTGDEEEEEESDIDLEEEEEKGKEKREQRKESGEIRIKTLAEIRQEKQGRLVAPVSTPSERGDESEASKAQPKKGALSATERRNRRRGEMALYKPPSAMRGLKENQGAQIGTRRSKPAEEDQDELEMKPAPKLRRLNLSRSVETANKGNESLLEALQQKKQDDAPRTAPSTAIKVKTLAEIRAEKQRLRQASVPVEADSGSDGQQTEEGTKEKEREEEGERKKTDEEKRRERWSNVWGSAARKDSTKPAQETEEQKSMDEIRRERRARLWNTAPAGDTASKPTPRRQGGQVTSSSPVPEIKIKTLAEIRREKQQQKEQQQERSNAGSGSGDQTTELHRPDALHEGGQRKDSAPVQTGAEESGDAISAGPASPGTEQGERRREWSPVKQSARIPSGVSTSLSVTSSASSSPNTKGTKLSRNPFRGRRERPVPITSQEMPQSSTSDEEKDQTLNNVTQSTSVISAHPAVSASTLEGSRHPVSFPAMQEREMTGGMGPNHHPAVSASTTGGSRHPVSSSVVQERKTAEGIASIHHPAVSASSTEGSRHSVSSSVAQEVRTAGGMAFTHQTSHGENSPAAQSTEKTHIPEPDTTFTSASVAKEEQAEPRPAVKRLTSETDDDLHRFLQENDNDDDLDSPPPAATAINDDDDLLNELDDFLNS